MTEQEHSNWQKREKAISEENELRLNILKKILLEREKIIKLEKEKILSKLK